MSGCADKALRALLRKAEGTWARQSGRSATIAFTDGSFPDYLNLPDRAAKEAAHAVLRQAESVGAVRLEWDRHAGADGQIVRLRLVDPERLAEIIGIKPLWRVCAEAEALLTVHSALPIITALHGAWRAGKSPRKFGPDRVREFVDAKRVIEVCRAQPASSETAVRRVSVRLFADSKRIEAITPAIDILLAASLADPPHEAEEVWASLGLMKHPQPLLISGKVKLLLSDGSVLAPIAPYAGFAPAVLAGAEFDPQTPYLLTVENLTTFNELATLQGPAVVLYCGGMPAPSFRRAYALLVRHLPAAAALLHWGDIDAGGFRIAAALARVAKPTGHTLQPWSMDPRKLQARGLESRPLTPADARDMARLARALDWPELASAVEDCPFAFEQEALDPIPPGVESGLLQQEGVTVSH